MTLPLDVLDISADFEACNDRLYGEGLTDGLPVVPPTRARVERMLAATHLAPDTNLGAFPPAYCDATVASIAVNAVMAGALPEYFPVILASIQALLDPQVNCYAINTTTHPVTAMLVVNGPIVQELKLNSGYNVFGQGWRANQTIGRAVRLCMVNIGGGTPGHGDRATHGHPGKISFCIAENEAASPFAPLHVRRGYMAEESTVTIFGAEAPHEINDHRSTHAASVLTTCADTFATIGNNNAYLSGGEIVLVLGPEHAQTIARSGWDVRKVQEYLFAKARNPAAKLRAVDKLRHIDPRQINIDDPDEMVPLVNSPEDVVVIVAGGAGKHSMAIHSFGITRSATVAIERR
ncbi:MULTISPECIES: hypothetical protein [unclassified Sphingobium]|uniref:hypothetical protein n=1 Tax=unclassified Sphingobium TaxID=2611147 RepID=UPI000D16006A|nr:MULTISPECIES: hypothetical protein [unclassified Sphingobium]MBG6120148.1 hypothetical protein [Sphingobium sp. JAI105]PSO12815.1 hypothetical protein C7E20_03375 [Sphingobium sp. AEW4]TWD05651.1 hypothetical protein FB595_10911 [Sphingobium sp. AEW010]TWD23204.1 hypothetical protein FB596_10911 [Sphingobium sp. AEW013]TWD25064.1 hypothetical protein FB594_10911 [Sphingobium sp. AEW001]